MGEETDHEAVSKSRKEKDSAGDELNRRSQGGSDIRFKKKKMNPGIGPDNLGKKNSR